MRIESKNTKARDDPNNYECHNGYRNYTRDNYENSHAYDWRAAKKEKITHKFGLAYSKFDGYPDLHVFNDWLANMECYCDCYEMSSVHKI